MPFRPYWRKSRDFYQRHVGVSYGNTSNRDFSKRGARALYILDFSICAACYFLIIANGHAGMYEEGFQQLDTVLRYKCNVIRHTTSLKNDSERSDFVIVRNKIPF